MCISPPLPTTTTRTTGGTWWTTSTSSYSARGTTTDSHSSTHRPISTWGASPENAASDLCTNRCGTRQCRPWHSSDCPTASFRSRYSNSNPQPSYPNYRRTSPKMTTASGSQVCPSESRRPRAMPIREGRIPRDGCRIRIFWDRTSGITAGGWRGLGARTTTPLRTSSPRIRHCTIAAGRRGRGWCPEERTCTGRRGFVGWTRSNLTK
mmetsp:Transcript_27489/g.66108  ORF Transcript_27489/g.66108 Transcript_27489/m.66108 type:complete len:208 (-) Transcript_27489:72-695(-)